MALSSAASLEARFGLTLRETAMRLLSRTTAVALFVCAAARAELRPRGGEFQVNQSTFTEVYPAVTMASDARFMVVWGTEFGSFRGDLSGRRFDALGSPVTDQFQVDASGYAFRGRPAIASAPDGRTTVSWHGFLDGSGSSVQARLIAAAGDFVGSAFQVNQYTTHHQYRPAIAIDGDGEFVVAWQSYGRGVFARRFDSSGSALSPEVQVKNAATSRPSDPAVGALPNGHFVVVWQELTEYYGYRIYGRRLDEVVVPLAVEFQVSALTDNPVALPAVASRADGGFVVVWQRSSQEAPSLAILGRRFDASGVAQGDEFGVSTDLSTHQSRAGIAMEPDGAFVVAWHGYAYGGPDDSIQVRAFDSSGTALATELRVNVQTTQFDRAPSVAADGSGHFVVVWMRHQWDYAENQGTGYRILARRFAASLATLDLDGDGAVDALTDSVLLLRQRLGFTDSALGTGAVAAACTRCDAAAIDAYVTSILPQLDVDGDGSVGALTDALLILRFAFGFRGDVLIADAVGEDCARCEADSIEAFLIPLFA
jgi:hypothetical protein